MLTTENRFQTHTLYIYLVRFLLFIFSSPHMFHGHAPPCSSVFIMDLHKRHAVSLPMFSRGHIIGYRQVFQNAHIMRGSTGFCSSQQQQQIGFTVINTLDICMVGERLHTLHRNSRCQFWHEHMTHAYFEFCICSEQKLAQCVSILDWMFTRAPGIQCRCFPERTHKKRLIQRVVIHNAQCADTSWVCDGSFLVFLESARFTTHDLGRARF